MWNGRTVSVALPTYNEKASIRDCIERFWATGVVDQIVVCNNNAAPGTSEEVAKAGAQEVFETRQGYGWSCRAALAETTGELIVLCEPDGSFEPQDVFKLLAYAEDFEVVFGSRTNSATIWSGANMGRWMGWANWCVGKYIEVLFDTIALTDAGCTMRLVTRRVLDRVQPRFSVGGSHFGVEMTLLCLSRGARAVEIPLNYKPRIGKSMVTGNRWVAVLLGLRMVWFVTRVRISSWLGLRPRGPDRGADQHPREPSTADRQREAYV